MDGTCVLTVARAILNAGHAVRPPLRRLDGIRAWRELQVAGAADWASVAVALALGVAGFVAARSISKDRELRIAERRLAAYERLWALMRPASPFDGPLDQAGRWRLEKKLADWYYSNGDGMLLADSSRSMYLKTKDNLISSVEALVPEESRRRLQRLAGEELDREHGLLVQRQLSLLRTQLKADLKVFGQPHGPRLGPEDRAFLRECGIDINRKPWKTSVQAIGKPGSSDKDSV
jgi:hypothetical protein